MRGAVGGACKGGARGHVWRCLVEVLPLSRPKAMVCPGKRPCRPYGHVCPPLAAPQGVFRGLQDTRTPFQATLVSAALNILLCPILVFGCRLGAAGAATATVVSQVGRHSCASRLPCAKESLVGRVGQKP
jgi:hypothetical protein